jgi:hypothetical protein
VAEPSDAQENKRSIRPYPIPSQLESGGVKVPVEIVRLNLLGAIIKLHEKIVHVGEHYNLEFQLPVLHAQVVVAATRVLKTYDKALNPKEHKVERMAELHFQKLTEEQREHILTFIRTIGQK